jgi:hypothetical protein
VARDETKASPIRDLGIGIGPIDGQRIPVVEIDYSSGVVELQGPMHDIIISYGWGTITVEST